MSNILEIKNLTVEYKSNNSKSFIKAVNNVSLNIKAGEIYALAGESGCGKSTLSKAITKLIKPLCGEILFMGKNIYEQTSDERKAYPTQVQMIFQNPYSSLNPKMKIGQILSEPLEINTNLTKEQIKKAVLETIKKVGLDETSLNNYPHEFSGGQRQRIAIARALILNPEFIIADEPVSALDVSIQAQIINLLKQLKQDFNLTFLFISHDLSVIKYLSDRIAVMYLGEIVEIGNTEEIFSNPKHPYSMALLSAVPELGGDKSREKSALKGELPSPENLPSGCKFHTRCPYVKDICKKSEPSKIDFSQTHSCKCFLYES
jgi:oligopeptide/dipeptide ABC transporter ATP-binding protein